MRVSIIIPTYNRCDTLVECLGALDHQTLDKALYDVVVVDDGSSDETAERVRALVDHWGGRLSYLRQANRGPAAARNAGVRHARGGLILFMGDDIIAPPDFVATHVSYHTQNPDPSVAVLGKTVWSLRVEMTPIMRWIERSGAQFDYQSLESREPGGDHFYTSNVSLKRELFLRSGGFDEDFPYAAYEDLELGMRLQDAGMQLLYRPDALAYHDHQLTVESFHRRSSLVGASAYILERKRPGTIVPSTLRHTIAKRAVLALGPLISSVGTERMKLLLHIVQGKQLFWQAFYRATARERDEVRRA